MNNFGFLQSEWPQLFADAQKAEGLVIPDPRATCFYARRTLELTVAWLYKSDPSLKLPYQDNLSALIHEPTFKNTVGAKIFIKAKLIKDLGNLAAHSPKPLAQLDSMVAVRELFHVCFWLARTYSKTRKPPDGLAFRKLLPSRGKRWRTFSSSNPNLRKKTRDSRNYLPAKPLSMPNWNVCAPRSPPSRSITRPRPIPTTTPRLKLATTSLTFCSKKPDGRKDRPWCRGPPWGPCRSCPRPWPAARPWGW